MSGPQSFLTQGQRNGNRDKEAKPHDKPGAIPAPLVKRVSNLG